MKKKKCLHAQEQRPENYEIKDTKLKKTNNSLHKHQLCRFYNQIRPSVMSSLILIHNCECCNTNFGNG